MAHPLTLQKTEPTKKYRKERLVAAVLATLVSFFSNIFNVSTASLKFFCLKYMTALFISRSLAKSAYWEFLIASTHLEKMQK